VALAAPGVAQAKTVRVFAVGPKLDLGWLDTRAHFHDHLVGLVDKSRRGPDVQAEADDVASHLRPDGSNLVTFPEDLGLMAIFTGQRGGPARGASSVTEAIADVLVAYAPQTAYYGAKYPALGSRGVPTRLLAIAGTDTFARVAVETYAEIAATYHVWLEAGIDMAQDWHVVCDSKATMPPLPGGVTCDEENPAKVAQLRGPDEPDRTYAYEATTDKASNMALVFDPTGKLVSKQIKTYLTPIELPSQLDLLPGEVFTGLSAVHTPVGTLGFVTSKDAWMPDVTARLDEEHVDLLVQPEYFVGDTIRTAGPWAPDNIQGAGYSDVLRQPSTEAMVLPELTGNLFDLPADNQQAIVVKPRSRRARAGFLVGQPAAPGYDKVGAWVAPDPLSPSETIAQRRARLGAIGEKLLPDANNPPCPSPSARGVCRGGQVEDVIYDDVQVGAARRLHRVSRRKRGRTPFSVDRPIAPARSVQRNVALAAHGSLVVAAFEQRTGGHDQVLVARSTDGGRRWRRARHVSGRAGADEWWPAVSIGPDGVVWLAWSDDGGGHGHRLYVARSTDRGASFSAPVAADSSVAASVQQMRPAIAATGRGRALVAFVDDRTRFTDDDLPQAGIWAVPFDGSTPGAATRLDSTAAPNELAKTLDHSWAPSLAVRGSKVEATWIDFRNYQWDVFARTSTDGGKTWGTEARVNDTPSSDEALEDTPRAAWTKTGPLISFTDWAKSADSATKASPLYDVDVSVPGGNNLQVDGHGGAHVDAFAPAIVAAGGGAIVAWQDHAHGPGDIQAARVTASRRGRPVRVDDSGATGWNQWRPALALSRSRVIAAWEDERDGPAQIFFARAPLRRIG
jgi:hypothetical protein